MAVLHLREITPRGKYPVILIFSNLNVVFDLYKEQNLMSFYKNGCAYLQFIIYTQIYFNTVKRNMLESNIFWRKLVESIGLFDEIKNPGWYLTALQLKIICIIFLFNISK